MKDPTILIVEFGSQFTPLIERSFRELGYRSAVLPPKRAEAWIRSKDPKAIILSGSRHSVNSEDAPTINQSVFENGTPILGICYGMQLIAKALGGSVVSVSSNSEYGPARVKITQSALFRNLPEETDVWSSHRDTVQTVPDGFCVTATAPDGAIAAMEDLSRQIWGVQFHPEVNDTVLGKKILGNFASAAGCEKDWHPADIVSGLQSRMRGELSDGRVAIAFSGGTDSTTLAALLSPVVGARLRAFCIDGGQLRKGELEVIKANADSANVELEVIHAEADFLAAFDIVHTQAPDPELKRRIFRQTYQSCLTRRLCAWNAAHFIQGTLAPDMIESGQTGGDVIKTHHNIGVMVKGCTSYHPFAHLFKYEVRALARELELPESVINRQPFPGPGLFIRIKNGWPNSERLDILRWADHEVTRIVKKAGIYEDVSQLVVGLPCGLSVGVKGDERAYAYEIVVRGVKTIDFMTAEGYQFPADVRREISKILF
ncbi:MAG: glutamine-hydrolyzing GMP synthase [Candidatus Pacebacteria bacterium]|nr:glutamine-hydrolyzing GMP synthase [Candidatus Paceibacterota bacterium]